MKRRATSEIVFSFHFSHELTPHSNLPTTLFSLFHSNVSSSCRAKNVHTFERVSGMFCNIIDGHLINVHWVIESIVFIAFNLVTDIFFTWIFYIKVNFSSSAMLWCDVADYSALCNPSECKRDDGEWNEIFSNLIENKMECNDSFIQLIFRKYFITFDYQTIQYTLMLWFIKISENLNIFLFQLKFPHSL